MIQLYDYQEKLGLETRASLRKNKSSLVVLPTGGGKSFITAWMVKNILAKGNTAYFCVHRRDLLTQMAGTFKKFGIPFGYIAAGKTCNLNQPVQICSIQTLARRLERPLRRIPLLLDLATRWRGNALLECVLRFRQPGGPWPLWKPRTLRTRFVVLDKQERDQRPAPDPALSHPQT